MARRTGLWSIALVIAMVAPALAHHSFAVYDHTRTVTLRGTVTKFQWTNPHGFIEMDVTQSDGIGEALQRRAHEHQHDAARRLAVEHDQGRATRSRSSWPRS